MKKKNLLFVRVIFLALMMPFIFSCNDDAEYSDVDGLPPVIALTATSERTEVGQEFTISGKITDNDGLRSIRLECREIYLDKTIDLFAIYEYLLSEYDLEYKFTAIEDEWEDMHFDIKVTATDVGNRVTEKTFKLSLDGDFTAPSFISAPGKNVTVLIKEETKFTLRFSVSDNKALDFVEYAIPERGINEKIELNGAKTFEYSEKIPLPSDYASYNLSLRVVDREGLEDSRTSVINVSELLDFEKMYLADVETAAELSNAVFGVATLIDHIGEFTYRARYYTKTANAGVRFIPQKTDFDPICFGINPETPELLTDEADIAEPIKLPEANKYYEIVFNTKTGEYSYQTYTPTDDPVDIGKMFYLDESRPDEGMIPLELGLIGSGIPNTGDWNPGSPLILTQDPVNPYLFTGTFAMQAGGTTRFVIGPKHDWGWWPNPFWRWDNGVDPEANVYLGGENPSDAGWAAKQTGDHIFEFDTHLLRSKLYPAK